jgi:hypothetical protein
MCETLQSTHIFLGRSDRSSSYLSSFLSSHWTQHSICLTLPLNIRRSRLRFSATCDGCVVRFLMVFLQPLQEPGGNVTLEVATWRVSRNFDISYLTVLLHFDAMWVMQSGACSSVIWESNSVLIRQIYVQMNVYFRIRYTYPQIFARRV